MSVIIFSPHCDDEVIGCFEILNIAQTIIYFEFDDERAKEANRLCRDFYIHAKLCDLKTCMEFVSSFHDATIFAPDPFTEIHPLHKAVGMFAYLLKYNNACKDVVFYSTNMTQPWIHECSEPNEKLSLLNKYYSSQSDLWKYDHKYYLFEGRYNIHA